MATVARIWAILRAYPLVALGNIHNVGYMMSVMPASLDESAELDRDSHWNLSIARYHCVEHRRCPRWYMYL